MLYELKNHRIQPVGRQNPAPEEDKPLRLIAVYPLLPENSSVYPGSISDAIVEKALANPTPRLESHDHLDIVCLRLLTVSQPHAPSTRMYIFFQQNLLQFLCETPAVVEDVFQQFSEEDDREGSLGDLICDLFERLIGPDLQGLHSLENQIAGLEDDVLSGGKKRNYTREIIQLRKQLMVISRYYEQLLDIFDMIDANENNLFDKHSLRYFRILNGKLERLERLVQSLRDYVTEIREAYQAEVDISLNLTMKVLTVITIICLPLTLIAGWFGMNFDMAVFHWPWGYPLVILISIAFVIATIAYCRRRRWF